MSDYPKGTKYITVRNEIWQCVVEEPPQKRQICYLSKNKLKSKLIDFPYYQIFYIRAFLHTDNLFYQYSADTKLVFTDKSISSIEDKVSFANYPDMYPDGKICVSVYPESKFEDLVNNVINKYWSLPLSFYYNATYLQGMISAYIGFKPKLNKNKIFLRPIVPVPLRTLFYGER